jgi:hypothetical protein
VKATDPRSNEVMRVHRLEGKAETGRSLAEVVIARVPVHLD